MKFKKKPEGFLVCFQFQLTFFLVFDFFSVSIYFFFWFWDDKPGAPYTLDQMVPVSMLCFAGPGPTRGLQWTNHGRLWSISHRKNRAGSLQTGYIMIIWGHTHLLSKENGINRWQFAIIHSWESSFAPPDVDLFVVETGKGQACCTLYDVTLQRFLVILAAWR